MSVVQVWAKIHPSPCLMVAKTTGKWHHLLFLCYLVPEVLYFVFWSPILLVNLYSRNGHKTYYFCIQICHIFNMNYFTILKCN